MLLIIEVVMMVLVAMTLFTSSVWIVCLIETQHATRRAHHAPRLLTRIPRVIYCSRRRSAARCEYADEVADTEVEVLPPGRSFGEEDETPLCIPGVDRHWPPTQHQQWVEDRVRRKRRIPTC